MPIPPHPLPSRPVALAAGPPRPRPAGVPDGSPPAGPPPSTTPTTPLVLVTGVGPVHGRGLCSVLDAGGVPSRFVREVDEVDAEAGCEAPCIVVVPQARCAEALAVLDRRPRPRVRLVLLLADDEPASYLAGLRAGAMSLVPASARLSDVVAVLTAAAHGFTVLPPGVLRDLCRPLATGQGYDMPLRERQWLRQIAEGVTVAELAQRSAYSEREMYRQLSAVYRRLGASNRTGALLAAQRSGLLAS